MDSFDEKIENKFKEIFNSISFLSKCDLENSIKFSGKYSASILKEYSTQRVLLTGDSAFLPDYFIGYGVASAISSAYIATNVIYENLSGTVIDYSEKIKKIHNNRLYSSYISCNLFNLLCDKDLDQLVVVLAEIEEKIGLELYFSSFFNHFPLTIHLLSRNIILSVKLISLFFRFKVKQYILFKNF